ncbi:hypothetical protein MKX01_017307, partial [Papaver californicum]
MDIYTPNFETPRKISYSYKKIVSKHVPVRRSPRLKDKENEKISVEPQGASRQLFTDLVDELGSQSCISQASVVGSSCQPVEVIDEEPVEVIAEEFNHEFWVNTTLNFNEKDNVQLENIDLDECHPIENPIAPFIFESDEENVDFSDYVKTYKVGTDNEKQNSSEEEDDK